jgi:peptidoglycan-associated lipoprotein
VTDRDPATADTEDGDDAESRGAQSDGAVSGEDLAPDAIDQDDGPLSKRVIYFAFDSSEIKTDYAKILAAHGEYLGANPDVSVTVEGHTDERGSREYNLALGERRAESVKQVLTLNGADSEQIETVSYGEERPAVEGHDEQAWSQNRRAKLVYSR